MRTRSKLGLKIAGALTLLTAAVGVPVLAQTPQYYAPTISPAPPGTLPPQNVRPGYGVNTNPGAPSYPSNPSNPSAPVAQTKPRLTQPVVAGSEGVRTAAASDFDITRPEMPKLPAAGAASGVPPAFFPPAPITGGPLPAPSLPGTLPGTLPEFKPPMVTAERPTIVAPAPAVMPMSPAPAPIAAPPSGLTPSLAPSFAPLPPMPSATPPSGVPMVGALSAKVSPNVSVEFEAPETVGAGQSLVYSLVVKNTGTTAVANVRIDEELPVGTTFVSSEPVAESNADGRLAWTVGCLEAGGEKRIKITV